MGESIAYQSPVAIEFANAPFDDNSKWLGKEKTKPDQTRLATVLPLWLPGFGGP